MTHTLTSIRIRDHWLIYKGEGKGGQGGGGVKYKKIFIRARENYMKKNHARQLTLKKYSCYGLKKFIQ